LARSICDRPVTGGLRFLDSPSHRRARDLPRPATRSPIGRPQPSLRGVPGPLSVDHGQSHLDGRRGAGRRLCPRDLDADLSAHRAGIIGDQHRRVSACPDIGGVVRLSFGLVSERRHRPEMDLHVVGDRLVRDDPHLHVCTGWTTPHCCSSVSRSSQSF